MTDAVWPDGAREALWQLAGDRFEFDDVAILTAMEPFVQQRIDAALSDIDEMVPPAIGIYQTIPDRVRLVIAQRDEAESIVADLRAALYGQPFGFTREDVEAVESAHAVLLRQHMGWESPTMARLASLADRIAALLPPETTA